MSEMIERVAKAMCRDRVIQNLVDYKTYPDGFIERATEAGYENFMKDAKIAIEAMKEPTTEMIKAGVECNEYALENEDVKNIYQTIINAALKE